MAERDFSMRTQRTVRTQRLFILFIIPLITALGCPSASAGVEVLLGITTGDTVIEPGSLTPENFETVFFTADPPEPARILGSEITFLQIGAMWTDGAGGENQRTMQLVIDSNGDGKLHPLDLNSPEHPWNRPDNGTPEDPTDDPTAWTYTVPEDYPDPRFQGVTLDLTWDSACECVVGFPEEDFDWEWYESRWDDTKTGQAAPGTLITDIWLPRDDNFALFPNGEYPIRARVDENGDGRFGMNEAHRTILLRIQTAALTGRVVDASGTPIPGASVDAVSGSALGFGTTDAEGYFTISGLQSGESYIVQVTATGKSTILRMDVTIPEDQAGADMGAIRMRDAVAITGVLKLDRNADGITDQPADRFQPFIGQWGFEQDELSVTVNAWNEDGLGWGSAEVIFQPGDSARPFTVDVPPAEAARYRISAGAGPYTARSASVLVSADGSDAGTLILTRAATLQGTVKLPVPVTEWTDISALAVNTRDTRDRYWGWGEIDPFHIPARCQIPDFTDRESCEAAGGTWIEASVSETPVPLDTGVFRFEGIPAGAYHIGIEVSGFKPRRILDVTVPRGEDRDLGAVALDRGAVLSGALTVLGDTTALAGDGFAEGDLPVWLSLWSPGSGETAGVEVRVPRGTDQRVSFEIGGLADGRYEAEAWIGDGYELVGEDGTAPVIVAVSGSARRNLFLMPYEGVIQGLITAAGVDIDPARLVVEVRRAWDWTDPRRATVNNGGIDPGTGEYRITGLGTDDFVVTAGMYDPAGESGLDTRFPDPAAGVVTRRVSVVNDADRPARVDIVLAPGRSVSGTLRIDPADPPWADIGDGEGGPPDGIPNREERITVAGDLAGRFVQAIPVDSLYQAGLEASDARLGLIVDHGDGTAGYRIDGLAQGAYLLAPPYTSPRIQALTPGDGDLTDLFGLFASLAGETRHWTARPRIIVIDDTDITGEAFTLANGHTVSGAITLPEAQTLQDVEGDAWSWVGHLSLQTPEETLLGHQRILFKRDFIGTDTAAFSFSHVADGEYLLYLYTDLYVTRRAKVTVNGADTSISLTVSAGVDLTGRLVDAETGSAVTAEDGIQVICESVPFSEGSYRETSADAWSRSYIEDGSDLKGSAESGADSGRENRTPGQFHLTAVETGLDYIVVVRTRPGARETGGRNYVGRVIAGIEAPAGASGKIDVGTIALTRGITLSGRITDTDGEPVPGVTVAAVPSDAHDGVSEITAVSDRTGHYVLFGINPAVNHYDLIAAPRPWLFEDWGKEVVWGEVRRYNIDPADIDPDTGRTVGAEFILRRATASLAGGITIPAGARFMLPFLADVGESYPAAYILLQRKGVVYRDMLDGIEGITRPRPKTARTAAYRIDHIQPGLYTVTFMNYGLPRAVIDNVAFAEGEAKVINAAWDDDFYRISGGLALDDGSTPSASDVSGVLCLNIADRSVVLGRLNREADDTISGYEVAGLAGSHTYQLIFYSDEGIDDTPTVFAAGNPFTPGNADIGFDAVIARDPEPILILRAVRDPENPARFHLAVFSTGYLADETAAAAETEPTGDTDGARLYLKSGGGRLSEVALSEDRRRITAVYEGGGSGMVALLLAVHYGSDAKTGIAEFAFDADAQAVNSDVIIPFIDEPFALGSGDATRLRIPAGTFDTAGGRNAVIAIEKRTAGESDLGLPADIAPAGDLYAITAADAGTGSPPAVKAPLTVQLQYDPASVPDTTRLHVYRRSAGAWVQETTSRVLDTENSTISVEVTGLSDFVAGYGDLPEDPDTSTPTVVVSGGGNSSDCFIGAAGTVSGNGFVWRILLCILLIRWHRSKSGAV
jgi:hypothetical protein